MLKTKLSLATNLLIVPGTMHDEKGLLSIDVVVSSTRNDSNIS